MGIISKYSRYSLINEYRQIFNKLRYRSKYYVYFRHLLIFSSIKKNHFLIHRGYLFVYRHINVFHKRKNIGTLSISRKLLNKPIRKNK